MVGKNSIVDMNICNYDTKSAFYVAISTKERIQWENVVYCYRFFATIWIAILPCGICHALAYDLCDFEK